MADLKNQTNQRNELWRRIRFNHGINLTDSSIKTIESFFHESIKASIYHVGMYRVINVVFAVLFMAGWIIFRNDGIVQWFVPVMFIGFMFYNIAHVLMNYIQYKRSEPEPVNYEPTSDLKTVTPKPVAHKPSEYKENGKHQANVRP